MIVTRLLPPLERLNLAAGESYSAWNDPKHNIRVWKSLKKKKGKKPQNNLFEVWRARTCPSQQEAEVQIH